MFQEDPDIAESRRTYRATEEGCQFVVFKSLIEERDLDTDVEMVGYPVERIEEEGAGTVLAIQEIGLSLSSRDPRSGHADIGFTGILHHNGQFAPKGSPGERPRPAPRGARTNQNRECYTGDEFFHEESSARES